MKRLVARRVEKRLAMVIAILGIKTHRCVVMTIGAFRGMLGRTAGRKVTEEEINAVKAHLTEKGYAYFHKPKGRLQTEQVYSGSYVKSLLRKHGHLDENYEWIN